eukprot:Hpha_TRINITY_DN35275_c0_g1::TRINITY_DN35275_c0_g1_i1::g.145193::m.145193
MKPSVVLAMHLRTAMLPHRRRDYLERMGKSLPSAPSKRPGPQMTWRLRWRIANSQDPGVIEALAAKVPDDVAVQGAAMQRCGTLYHVADALPTLDSVWARCEARGLQHDGQLVSIRITALTRLNQAGRCRRVWEDYLNASGESRVSPVLLGAALHAARVAGDLEWGRTLWTFRQQQHPTDMAAWAPYLALLARKGPWDRLGVAVAECVNAGALGDYAALGLLSGV